jgi:DnaJ domain
MASNHYQVLGVPPDAEQPVIRAAYLALMRLHHPDQNGAQPSLEKAQQVSSAYAVLGDPKRRRDYDGRSAPRLIDLSAKTAKFPSRRRTAGRNAALLIAAGTLGLLAFVTTRDQSTPWSRGSSAAGEHQGYTMIQAGPNGNDCSSRIDGDAVRGAIFAEASRLATGDGSVLRHAATASVLRLSDIDAEEDGATGHWRCSATVSVDLPPGTVTAGGQSRIIADLAYSIDRAPGSDRQRIAVPAGELVATSLSRVRRAGSEASSSLASGSLTRSPTSLPAALPVPRVDRAPALSPPPPITLRATLPSEPPLSPATARPRAAAPRPVPRPQSLPAPERKRDVALASTPATVPARMAVPPTPAASPPARNAADGANLAYLDRLSSMLYNQSVANADVAKRGRLTHTRDSFVARLKGCTTNACRKATYLARNGEIVSIMRDGPP